MRLIDADAIEYTMLYKENWLEGTGYEAQAVWKSDIDKMPTAEKRGRWIEDGHYERCSECGEYADELHNYCPNCGCAMKGEDE